MRSQQYQALPSLAERATDFLLTAETTLVSSVPSPVVEALGGSERAGQLALATGLVSAGFTLGFIAMAVNILVAETRASYAAAQEALEKGEPDGPQFSFGQKIVRTFRIPFVRVVGAAWDPNGTGRKNIKLVAKVISKPGIRSVFGMKQDDVAVTSESEVEIDTGISVLTIETLVASTLGVLLALWLLTDARPLWP